MNLVDTSGWLEFFFGSRNASYFARPLKAAGELIVPTICIYEVFKKINLVANEARALQAVAQMKRGIVVDMTENVALSAALISIRHKIPMADSMIYATARAHRAILWTQDEHFRDLPGVNYRKPSRKPTAKARPAPRRKKRRVRRVKRGRAKVRAR